MSALDRFIGFLPSLCLCMQCRNPFLSYRGLFRFAQTHKSGKPCVEDVLGNDREFQPSFRHIGCNMGPFRSQSQLLLLLTRRYQDIAVPGEPCLFPSFMETFYPIPHLPQFKNSPPIIACKRFLTQLPRIDPVVV